MKAELAEYKERQQKKFDRFMNRLTVNEKIAATIGCIGVVVIAGGMVGGRILDNVLDTKNS